MRENLKNVDSNHTALDFFQHMTRKTWRHFAATRKPLIAGMPATASIKPGLSWKCP